MGNIIITGLEAPNRGILIDLDNAIVLKDHKALIDDERTGTIAFMSYEILANTPYFAGSVKGGPAGDEKPSSMELEDESEESKELEGVAHGAVHDLESFFWVLCWLCVAREGPGRARHFSADGLNEEQKAQAMQIQTAIALTFEQKSITGIADRKKNILTEMGGFTKFILNSFTPYFKPLKKLLRWLHGDLHYAYKDRNFNGLHEKFLEYLIVAEQSPILQDWEQKDEYNDMWKNVSDLRREAATVWDSPKPERIAQPNEATSSSNMRTGSKRRRADEELEPIAEQPEDESSSASSEERNTTSAARKRQRTAGSSQDQQSEDAESATADDARSSSPLRGKGKAAKKAGKAKIAETKKAAAKTKATTSKMKATTAEAKAKAAETAAKTPARRSARLAQSKDNSSRSGRR
ncbi:hypothetical protein EWM64_g8575 [Hericium alpestre]|uniref:Fungal-type protein kinase domain-containing protein n=1 Tax=Hericium alpestre TaxID=135208 RepID=A0A4Y9ZPL0_9AGAM|nr:hypothetical protein EWM64_g8575 [Hericium alpestre]